MLRQISWSSFFSVVWVIVVLYYASIVTIFYRTRFLAWAKKRLAATTLVLAIAGGARARAQTADGNNGINQANTLIRSYFQTGTQLMYAIGALVGLVGAVRVFVLWNSGHRDEMNKAAAAWFGSCIFLVVVTLIIQSFFGL
jgi:Domain of unknown function (DUF4134)